MPERAGSWLHTVARNIAISNYRRRRNARPREVPLDEEVLSDNDGGLERVFDAWLIAAALDKLIEEHRVVIVALFYQRRSIAEVARLLTIPEGTVRSRCFYGLRRDPRQHAIVGLHAGLLRASGRASRHADRPHRYRAVARRALHAGRGLGYRDRYRRHLDRRLRRHRPGNGHDRLAVRQARRRAGQVRGRPGAAADPGVISAELLGFVSSTPRWETVRAFGRGPRRPGWRPARAPRWG